MQIKFDDRESKEVKLMVPVPKGATHYSGDLALTNVLGCEFWKYVSNESEKNWYCYSYDSKENCMKWERNTTPATNVYPIPFVKSDFENCDNY